MKKKTALLLALLMLLAGGFLPARPAARAEGAPREISVAGLTLMTGTAYTVYLEPTVRCEPTFTPRYVTITFHSANDCILSWQGQEVAMGRFTNNRFIDLFAMDDDPAKRLVINGTCDTDVDGADFAVRVSGYIQGIGAVPVFGAEASVDIEAEAARALAEAQAEQKEPVTFRAGSLTLAEDRRYTLRVVPDPDCDTEFVPFTVPVEFFSELGAYFVMSQYKNISSVYPVLVYREDSGWIEFSAVSGKFWGMADAGTEGADLTFRVVGLEKNLAGLFTVTAVRTPVPTSTPAPTAVPLPAFDPELYPYYGSLNAAEKGVYAEMYQALADHAESVTLTNPVSNADVNRILWYILCDQPQLFWASRGYSPAKYENGQVKAVRLTYGTFDGDLRQEKDRVETAVQRILRGASGMSEVQAERYVHDLLARETVYVAGSPHNQDIYSALVNRETVCAGYAKAFQYIMQRLGIPCYYCVGTTVDNAGNEGRHAWNIIRLGGSCYNVDLTWDDWYGETDKPFSCVTYEFYNLTDGQIAREHTREEDSTRLPRCSGTEARFDALYGRSWQAEVAAVNGIPVIGSLDAYYALCYDELLKMSVGDSRVTWFLVTDGSMLDQLNAMTQNEGFKAGYLNRFFKTRNYRSGVWYNYSFNWCSVSSRSACYAVELTQMLWRE